MTSKNDPTVDDPRFPGVLCDANPSSGSARVLFIPISREYKGHDTEIWMLWSRHFAQYWTDLYSIEVWNPDHVRVE